MLIVVVCPIGEAVDTADAHIGEALCGTVSGGLVVVFWDKGHADGDMLGTDEGEQQLEVVPCAGAVATRVGAVGVGIALFYVDDKIADYSGGLLDGFVRHL